jgi:hypothetical protein
MSIIESITLVLCGTGVALAWAVLLEASHRKERRSI